MKSMKQACSEASFAVRGVCRAIMIALPISILVVQPGFAGHESGFGSTSFPVVDSVQQSAECGIGDWWDSVTDWMEDQICNRSMWLDFGLLTGAGIEWAVAQWLTEKRIREPNGRILETARAARYLRYARVLTGLGIAQLAGEGVLLYYDNNICK